MMQKSTINQAAAEGLLRELLRAAKVGKRQGRAAMTGLKLYGEGWDVNGVVATAGNVQNQRTHQ